MIPARLSRRSAHTRHLKSGRVVKVRECWVLRERITTERRRSYRHPCPRCGAEIISVQMPNGGWVHFEGERGLERIKHPCMHIGESIKKRKDDLTLDLFKEKSSMPSYRKIDNNY